MLPGTHLIDSFFSGILGGGNGAWKTLGRPWVQLPEDFQVMEASKRWPAPSIEFDAPVLDKFRCVDESQKAVRKLSSWLPHWIRLLYTFILSCFLNFPSFFPFILPGSSHIHLDRSRDNVPWQVGSALPLDLVRIALQVGKIVVLMSFSSLDLQSSGTHVRDPRRRNARGARRTLGRRTTRLPKLLGDWTTGGEVPRWAMAAHLSDEVMEIVLCCFPPKTSPWCFGSSSLLRWSSSKIGNSAVRHSWGTPLKSANQRYHAL